ncbi:MAG TPA: MaoC family dehydratase [Thermohalobaculum sp.]|nr:MaoC family dehydratase [Thermohalobaculum sp.]
MFLDDLEPGLAFETASRTLSEEDIVAFARLYDPQPFHVDPAAAAASPYGGIIASGFHTMLTAFALTLEANVWNEASLGSPGMDDIRWLAPVRPGDTLSVRGEVLSVAPSRSRPDRGRAEIAYSVRNAQGVEVMRYRCIHILARRQAT